MKSCEIYIRKNDVLSNNMGGKEARMSRNKDIFIIRGCLEDEEMSTQCLYFLSEIGNRDIY